MPVEQLPSHKDVQGVDETFVNRLVSDCTAEAFYKTGYVRLDGWYHTTEVCRDVNESFKWRIGQGELTDDAIVRMLEGRLIDEYTKPALAKKGYETNGSYVIPAKGYNRLVKIIASPDAYNEKMVLELKTCVNVPRVPYPQYVKQTNFYMHVLGVSKGFIVYIPRFGQNKSFEVTYDSQLFHETYEAVEQLDMLVRKFRGEI